MNGYAESIDLYEQSLESAGLHNLNLIHTLRVIKATLDKFRTTVGRTLDNNYR